MFIPNIAVAHSGNRGSGLSLLSRKSMSLPGDKFPPIVAIMHASGDIPSLLVRA